MSIDFFQRLIMSEGTYVHQMSCTRKDFPTKISLKMHFWKDFRGVLKKSFILKDPVQDYFNVTFHDCSPLQGHFKPISQMLQDNFMAT